jgi:sucrose-6-phosphate hydrolase SacC (GH32 family)
VRKNLNRLLLGLLLCVLMITVLSVSIESTSAATYSAYVMGYFKESPNGSANSPNLHLAVSTDGLNWIPLNQNNYVLKPTMGTGYLRDPHFCRKQDGTFVIVATDNWNSEYIHIWDSTDLRTFTNERLVRMNTTGMHAWAPETFYDASRGQYAIVWSGNTDRNRIYVSYTTDFVNVTSPQVFFDPGFSVIDGHMEVGVNGYNYLYYKNETDYKIYGTRSTTLDPGSFNSNTYTTTGYGPTIAGSHIEAPIVMKSLTSNTW